MPSKVKISKSSSDCISMSTCTMFFQDTVPRLNPVVCPHRGTTFYFLPPQVAVSLCSRAAKGGQTYYAFLEGSSAVSDGLFIANHTACCTRLSIRSAVESLEICPALLSGQDKHGVTMCVQKKDKKQKNSCAASNDRFSRFKPAKRPSEAHFHHVSIHTIEHSIHFGVCESQALTR